VRSFDLVFSLFEHVGFVFTLSRSVGSLRCRRRAKLLATASGLYWCHAQPRAGQPYRTLVRRPSLAGPSGAHLARQDKTMAHHRCRRQR
jgi:hypothetical protein